MGIQHDPLDMVKKVRYTASIDKRAEVIVYERESGLFTVSVELRGVINPNRTVETLEQDLLGDTIDVAVGMAVAVQVAIIPVLSDHDQVRAKLAQLFDFRSDRQQAAA